MTDEIPPETTILPDVNVLAIGLTDDHPAFDDVRPWLTEALDGPNVLLVPDYYPLRAQYIMTSEFGVDPAAARTAVQSLVTSPARIVGATATDLLDAYELSAEKSHDVYDSFVLSMARSHDADYLVTTDTDFDALCTDESVTYRNPIPEGKLETLSTVEG